MKRYCKRFFYITLLLFWQVGIIRVALAQVKQITLTDALEIAKQNYPSIKAKQAEVGTSGYAVKESKTAYIPDVLTQNQALYGTANGVRGAFFPAEGTAIPISGGITSGNGTKADMTAAWGSFSTFMVDWKVFSFGRVRASIATSKAEYARSNADYDNEVFQHQIQVVDAYLLLLVEQRLITLQQNNLQRAEGFVTVVRATTRSGLKPGADSSFANAEHAKARLSLLQAERNERAQRIRLAELLGSSSEDIAVDTAGFLSSIPSSVTDTKLSLDNNPLLRYHKLNMEVANAKRKQISRSYLPSIGLMAVGWARGTGINNDEVNGQYTYKQGIGQGLQFSAYDYMFNVHFKWTISDYPKYRYQASGQKMIAEKNKYLYDEQRLKLERALENANMQTALSIAQTKIAPIQLESARSSFYQSQSRYKVGLATLPELAQSLFLMNRSEIDVSISYNNVWRAVLMKAAAVGDISLFTDLIK